MLRLSQQLRMAHITSAATDGSVLNEFNSFANGKSLVIHACRWCFFLFYLVPVAEQRGGVLIFDFA